MEGIFSQHIPRVLYFFWGLGRQTRFLLFLLSHFPSLAADIVYGVGCVFSAFT